MMLEWKGVLELYVLKLLEKRDWYGYELVTEISKLKESKEGPPRKYYNLTDKGRRMSSQLTTEWDDFVIRVKQFIK